MVLARYREGASRRQLRHEGVLELGRHEGAVPRALHEQPVAPRFLERFEAELVAAAPDAWATVSGISFGP